MKPVSDPNLIAELEGNTDAAPPRPVTDPALIKQLDGGTQEPGFFAKVKDAFTGELRTEFPDAPEFASAIMKGGIRPEDEASLGNFDLTAVSRSAISSNPAAQIDILRKSIPGLEDKTDKFGNVMVRAPRFGVNDWTYLNKPGMSGQDLNEVGTQVLATLPFLGAAGQGATIPARIASGAGFMGAGELAREGVERAAGSEQKPGDRQLSTVTALGGALAPGVPSTVVEGAANAIGAVTAPIRNVARSAISSESEAARRVATSYRQTLEGAGRSEMTPDQLRHAAANQLQERTLSPGSDASFGGETRLMDLMGERGRALARSAANTSPEARDTLNAVIQPRFETQAPRTAEFLENLVGGDMAGRSRQALEEMAYRARAPFYEAAFRNGSEGITSPALVAVTHAPVVRTAMDDAVEALQNKAAAGRMVTAAHANGVPTLEFWDQVKRNLNDQYNRLAGQGRNSAAADVAALTDRLVTALDHAVPSYRQARGVAMGIFRANNALDAGENFVASRLGNAEAERALAEMTRQERDLFRQGYVSRLLAATNETGDRRSIVNLISQSPAARERLEIAIGPRQARELEAFLHHEQLMDLSRAAVSGNSTTARQLAELGLAGGVGGLVSGFDPSNPAGWIAGILTKYGAGRANAAVDTNVANHVARMLASRDPDVMRRGLRLVASHPRMLSALRRFDDAVSGVGRSAAIQEGARSEGANDLPRPSTFNEALKLPPGARFIDPQGVERVNKLQGRAP